MHENIARMTGRRLDDVVKDIGLAFEGEGEGHVPSRGGDESYEQIGRKRKEEMDALLAKKRPDLTAEQRAEAIAEIEKLGEEAKAGGDPKTEKAATYWLLNGHIRLPEGSDKVHDAMRICEQEGLDPFSFVDPSEILVKYTFKETKAEQRIDSDTLPELSNKRDIGNGIVIYDVEDTKEGMAAVRRIVDTHWGKRFNNWCLTRIDEDGSMIPEAWEMWRHYSRGKKRIAFKDGKLLAFSATDTERVKWWD